MGRGKRPPRSQGGGIGKRKQQSIESLRKGYRLYGVPRGTRVAACLDMRYGRWELGYRTGTYVDRVGTRMLIEWDDGTEDIVDEGDARYWVDRGKWRLTGPDRGSLIEAAAGKPLPPPKWDYDANGHHPALTAELGSDRLSPSPHEGATDRGDSDMARSKRTVDEQARDAELKAHAEAVDAAADEIDDDEVEDDEQVFDDGISDAEQAEPDSDGELDDDEPETLAEGKVFSSAEAAEQLGVDGKALRRFLRSQGGSADGKRYEFTTERIAELREAMKATPARKPREPKAEGEPRAKRTSRRKADAPSVTEEIEDEDDELREPTDEELAAGDDDIDDLLDDLDS